MKSSRRSSRRAFVATTLAALPAFSAAAAKKSAAAASIAVKNSQFEAAHVKGDAVTLARQYTLDGQALWGPEGIVTGREAIEKLWKSEIGSGGRSAQLQTLEVQEAGNWAYEVGRFIVHDASTVLINDSNYIVIWKKTGGEWLIHRDIGSENRVKK